jgi:hypothetical protein
MSCRALESNTTDRTEKGQVDGAVTFDRIAPVLRGGAKTLFDGTRFRARSSTCWLRARLEKRPRQFRPCSRLVRRN